jgi:hypothetical protein
MIVEMENCICICLSRSVNCIASWNCRNWFIHFIWKETVMFLCTQYYEHIILLSYENSMGKWDLSLLKGNSCETLTPSTHFTPIIAEFFNRNDHWTRNEPDVFFLNNPNPLPLPASVSCSCDANIGGCQIYVLFIPQSRFIWYSPTKRPQLNSHYCSSP